MHICADLDLNNARDLKIQPLLFLGRQGSYLSGGAGTSLEIKHLAVNTMFLGDNGNNVNMQAGFSFRTSMVSVYYNYQFNIKTENSMLPFSLLHQVGLAFSLINVEKRNAIKTINFPKL